MPNIKSAIKRVDVNRARNARNQVVKSALKTTLKKVDGAIAAGDKALAETEFKCAVSKLDKAVARGIMHKNAAAHRKSALSRALSAI